MSILRDSPDVPTDPTDAGLLDFIEQLQTARFDDRPRPSEAGNKRSLLALQPHPDDVALSVGGILVQLAVPLTIITVYAKALDPADTPRRRAEDQSYAAALGARLHVLPFQERPSASEQRTAKEVASALVRISDLINPASCMTLAPAGVARHVDHLAVHEIGRQLGQVTAYWEDVAFWSIYAASVEDRVLFSERHSGWLQHQVLLAVDISAVARRKAALLRCYPSQSQERWRPLRFAWSAARELGRTGYCERLFVPADLVDTTLDWLDADSTEGPTLHYGATSLPTVWATIKNTRTGAS